MPNGGLPVVGVNVNASQVGLSRTLAARPANRAHFQPMAPAPLSSPGSGQMRNKLIAAPRPSAQTLGATFRQFSQRTQRQALPNSKQPI